MHGSSPSGFKTTSWTIVLAAADEPTNDSRAALARLCETYWKPVYAFVRRSGYDQDQAHDLTQGFFTLLIEKNYVKVADPQRGRFRSFLLTAVKRFLTNEYDRCHALKRGGGLPQSSMDVLNAEAWYGPAAAAETTPESLFDRSWAVALLGRAMATLRTELAVAGKSTQFDCLAPFLNCEADGIRYEEVAASLGVSAGSLRTLVHRMRRRYGELLRAEIAETVGSPEEVDEEIRFLLRVMSS